VSSRAPETIAVLMGGPSAEREVSLSSGRECASALREAGFEVVEIDAAGLRGAVLGGAVMNAKHPNFLTNAGGATAADLESLGELVRKKVYENSGITLQWEIMRVGDPLADQTR